MSALDGGAGHAGDGALTGRGGQLTGGGCGVGQLTDDDCNS